MSRSRSVKIRRSAKVTNHLKNNNIVLLKLFDPIIQSVIFIIFLYCLDSESHGISYRSILLLLVAWQLASSFLNFFLKDPKLLKMERISYVIVMTIYMIIFFIVERRVKEHYIGINETDIPNIPVYQASLMTGVVIITFWYNIICYREIRSLLGGSNKYA